MSVDPFIHGNGNSQGINPYSYILNNPLSGTDPTGYTPEEDVETKTFTVQNTGSRIKRKVTASVSSNGSGGATITFSGKNGAAVSAVKNAVSSALSGAGFNVADIGSQQKVATNFETATHNKQFRPTQEQQASVDSIVNEHLDSDTAAQIDSVFGDSSSDSLTASRGGRGRATSANGLQPFINARYNQLFQQIREINPNFQVARPQGPLTRRDIQFLESQLTNMRGAPPLNLSPLGAGRRGAFREAKRLNGIPVSQQPSRIVPNRDLRGNLQPGEIFFFRIPNGSGGFRETFLRRDAAGHFYGPNNIQNRGPHFNDARDRHFDY